MPPLASRYYSGYSRFGHPKKDSKFPVGYTSNGVNTPYLSNMRLCELGGPYSFTPGCKLHGPSLSNPVGHIVGMSAHKQMRRIATRWVVAVMAAIKFVRNWTVGNFPSLSMSKASTNVIGERAKHSIAMIVNFPNERPAFIRSSLVHLFPKSVRNRREFNFPPSGKRSTFFNGDCFYWCMWVFEFHTGGLCSASKG